jgi:hypothetical protein
VAAPTLAIDRALDPCPVRAGLVWGLGMPGCPAATETPSFLAEVLERVRAAGDAFLPADRRAAVRSMLRYGKYRPAGRSKPASEYLLAAALAGEFPLVNGPVDVNNAVSLAHGYPASVFDIERSGPDLLLRRGTAGESYVFNPSGQRIDLEDLLCLCRRSASGWEPCGTPVKDAMITKVGESTRGVVAVIYAPAGDPVQVLETAAAEFARLLHDHCAAGDCGSRIV